MRWVARWVLAITVSVTAFAVSWWLCQGSIGLDEGAALGIAGAVLTVVLAVAGWWAIREQPNRSGSALAQQNLAQGSFASPAQPILVPNTLIRAPNIIIAGEIPHEAAAFEERRELQDEVMAGCVVPAHPTNANNLSVIVGMRGAGKSQLASAIARGRLDEGWSVVAWINADNMDQLTLGLSRLAAELGLSSRDSDPYESALRVRHWLESDADQAILVLDNASDADTVRHFLPVRSKAQIIITGSNRTLTSLGKSVEVGVFTPGQAIRFLMSRTGHPDSEGAREVASALGFLPLALAQAASVIVGQNFDYATYLEHLRGREFTEYLYRTANDPYPRGVVPAVLLSLKTVETASNARICRQVMEFAAVLSPAGIRRIRLYAASTGSPAAVDVALHTLVNSSLLTWAGADGSFVTPHPLVARIVRERAITDRTMPAIASRISKILNLANQKDSADFELPGEAKASTLHWAMLKITKKVVRFIYRNNPVEKLADDELRCIFALVDNLVSTYDKLSIVCQARLDMFQSYCDGYMFGGRLSNARAIENAGHLREAAEAYERLLAEQEKQIWPHRMFIDSIRRDLTRVHAKLQNSQSPRDL